MKFKTSDLPGIGKRYSLTTSQGKEIVLITHHHGQRELYYFDQVDDDEPMLSFGLSDEEARQMGAILLGVDYQPVAEDKMELMLGNIRVHWVQIPRDSCMANKTIAQSEIRAKTGVTIIGIKRGNEIHGSPDVNEVLLPGDILMVIGKRDPIKALENMCRL